MKPGLRSLVSGFREVLGKRFQSTSLTPDTYHLPETCNLKPVTSLVAALLVALFLSAALSAQSTSATINGQVTDPSGKVVPGTAVSAVNIDTNITYPSKTNDTGIYVIPNLPPGRYRLVLTKDGFKQINKTDITLNVQDDLEQNFSLEVGSTSESVTVEGGGVNINTTDGSVSTVIDRQFVENMPKSQGSGVRGQGTGLAILAFIALLLTASTRRDQLVRNGQCLFFVFRRMRDALPHSKKVHTHAIASSWPSMQRVWPEATSLAKSDKFGLRSATHATSLAKSRVLHRVVYSAATLLAFLSLSIASSAQSTSATLNGQITDPSGKVIPGTSVQAVNIDTNISYPSRTNETGIYVIPNLPPGRYRLVVLKDGFKQINKTDITLNVQDNLEQNFSLEVGSTSESVTVSGSGVNINTTDGSVSTVIDRQFVENMPLNGRSFQDLLTLSPGVIQVPTPSVGYSGEFAVNGQRTEGNYFTVDGVSANTGVPPSNFSGGAGYAGALPGETALGTTQSIVPVDALQEFRANTSTYSAEYGRTPGGQFSFSTRAGANRWQGSLFDYFRNDALDSNNWFNDSVGASKTPERQNDFGGTFGGHFIPDKMFFFGSYEGLRLTVPQALQQFSVPDGELRQTIAQNTATASLAPFLNAFPVANAGEDGLDDGFAFFNEIYSSPSSLDNFGIRVDRDFGAKLRIFGRYSRTSSSGWNYSFPAFKNTQSIDVQGVTLGAISVFDSARTNEFHFNFTDNSTNNAIVSTNFGGALPLSVTSLPGNLPQKGTEVDFGLFYGGFPFYQLLQNSNGQDQYNVNDIFALSLGVHKIKIGFDWRRLTTLSNFITNDEFGYFFQESSVLANSVDSAGNAPATLYPFEPVYRNFSTFVQDDLRIARRASLSLGLRWDVNPAPGNLKGPLPYTVDQVSDLSTAKLAPAGTPVWQTDWRGFAPRVGLAYQLRQARDRETVLRTGFGVFYDMGNAQGSVGVFGIGFTSSMFYSGVPFPLTSSQLALPAPSVAAPYETYVFAFDPHLKLPYTEQWNVSLEQALGANSALSLSYIGSRGQNLLTQFNYIPNSLGNLNFAPGVELGVTANRSDSNYQALQVKFQRSLAHGFQILASHSFSHSIDNASTNFLLTELLRANSDFDVRQVFQAAATYDIPLGSQNSMLGKMSKGWGIDARVVAHSGLPIDIVGRTTFDPVTHQFTTYHPNFVSGQKIYVSSLQSCPATISVTNPTPAPGGRLINLCAFNAAPGGTEGNVPRNFARGFDAIQVNTAVRRDFPLKEGFHVQFRAEAFNLLNHPSFGSIYNSIRRGPNQFGYAYQTLNTSLGGLNSLYQVGGPRSLQLMLKLQF